MSRLFRNNISVDFKSFETLDLPYSVGYVENVDDLDKVYALDCAAYGELNIDRNTLVSWWHLHNKGIFVVKKDLKVIGAMGIFPLSVKVYNALKSGKLSENEIYPSKYKESKYWYVSGIVIDEKYRSTRVILYILYISMWMWFRDNKFSEDVVIGSIPISEMGKKLLNRFKFECDSNFCEIKFFRSDLKKLIYSFNIVPVF